METKENVVLCGANSYEQKFYLNPDFEKLPESICDELKIICVSFTEDVGGILTFEFEEDGTLILKTIADDADYLYDEIGAGLKIHQLQRTQKELFEQLETYYRIQFMKEEIPEELKEIMDLLEKKEQKQSADGQERKADEASDMNAETEADDKPVSDTESTDHANRQDEKREDEAGETKCMN